MTSIEFLIKELNLEGYDYTIQQAKELHKQEIIDAVGVGSQFNRDYLYGYHDKAEQYYQETFVSKGSDDHIVDTNEMVEVPKQQETLYTEEQVIGFSKWADDFGYMYNSSANCWYTQDGYKRTDEEMIYQYKQSLKQPKKD